MRKLMISAFVSWLPLSAGIVCLCGITYLAVQQNIRQSANLLPVQYATDIREKLENGTSPQDAIAGIPKTDMTKSIGPFVIVYSGTEAIKASTTTINGYFPIPPAGVFEAAKSTGENRLSWQPRNGIRVAAVVVPYTIDGMEGFVLAGRSLSEFEKTDRAVYLQTLTGMIVTLLVTYTISLVIKMAVNWAKAKNAR